MDSLDKSIAENLSYDRLPSSVKHLVQDSKEQWIKHVKEYSLQNQLRYSGNLISTILDERAYYLDLLEYSKKHLMVFPYHLISCARNFRRLRATPFSYYIDMLLDLMKREKSYDTLPNFAAADCVRVLGIGRNQYIEIMNRCRMKTSWTLRRFKKLVTRDMLPAVPPKISIEPWWCVYLTKIVEEDVRNCTRLEKEFLDLMLSRTTASSAGEIEYSTIHSLYSKGLVFFDVPVNEDDHVVIPPLEGFVMNRTSSGDYLEKLLYQIFVSIDENIAVRQLAAILEVDVSSVQHGISLYCRLNFAKIKEWSSTSGKESGAPIRRKVLMGVHPSWTNYLESTAASAAGNETGNEGVRGSQKPSSYVDSPLLNGPSPTTSTSTSTSVLTNPSRTNENPLQKPSSPNISSHLSHSPPLSSSPSSPSSAFHPSPLSLSTSPSVLSPFSPSTDSRPSPSPSLPLSSSLLSERSSSPSQSISITPKNSKKSLRAAFVYDSTLTAFLMMGSLSPGLKTHAVTLFEVGKLPFESLFGFLSELGNVSMLGDEHTQKYSDHAFTLKDSLKSLISPQCCNLRLDMVRSESITNLDASTRTRVLSHNYDIMVYMAPFSCETHPGVSIDTHIFGPPIPEVNSIWFKLFLYYTVSQGPRSILFTKGTRLSRIPELFRDTSQLFLTQWDSERTTISTSTLLSHVNDLLMYSPVLVSEASSTESLTVQDISFPVDPASTSVLATHEATSILVSEWNLDESFGFIRFMKIDGSTDDDEEGEEGVWVPLELHYGIPLFDAKMNEAIFRQIVSRDTFGPSNSHIHSLNQKKLCLTLLSFIDECMGDSVDLIDEFGMGDSGSQIYPSHSIVWDGKTLTPFR